MRILLLSLVLAVTFIAAPAAADKAAPAPAVILSPVATCIDLGQSGVIPLRPPCTFEGWSAEVDGRTLPAKPAPGARWLPKCSVDAEGACAFEVAAVGEVFEDEFRVTSYTVTPVGNVTATGRLLVPRDVSCTEEECGADDPCCHGCNHGGWTVMNRRPELPAYSAAGVPDLPQCPLDGCGSCDHRLTAWGVEVGGLFIVSSHAETSSVALMPSARCTMMACASANPCCNTCGFMGWTTQGSTGTLSAVVGEGVDPLPECEVDGCGRCSWVLLVEGEEKGGSFVVTSWEKFPEQHP